MARKYLKPEQQLGQISFAEMLDRIGAEVAEALVVELARIGLVPSRLADSASHKAFAQKVEVYLNSYYQFVESGRRAGAKMPPEIAIIEWMKRLGIATGKNNEVVWAIRKAIAKRGIQPRPFVRRAIETAGAKRIAPIFTFEARQLGEEYAERIKDALS